MGNKERPTIYVSGPITSATPEEMAAKQEAGVKKGAELAKKGYAPIIPHANLSGIHRYGEFGYDDYMRMDFAHVKISDKVYMMKGWENSRGARLEERYARLLHKDIIYEEPKKRPSKQTRTHKPRPTLQPPEIKQIVYEARKNSVRHPR